MYNTLFLRISALEACCFSSTISQLLICCFITNSVRDFFSQLAGLSADDMIAVNNMRCLCAHETKKSSKGGFPVKFEMRKVTCRIILLVS